MCSLHNNPETIQWLRRFINSAAQIDISQAWREIEILGESDIRRIDNTSIDISIDMTGGRVMTKFEALKGSERQVNLVGQVN